MSAVEEGEFMHEFGKENKAELSIERVKMEVRYRNRRRRGGEVFGTCFVGQV